MIYLFDPINNVKTETDYKLLSGMTGLSINSLQKYKCVGRKIKNINSYIVDAKVSKAYLIELREKEEIKDEIWKGVVGLEDRFEISSYGRLRNFNTKRLLNPSLNRNKTLSSCINYGDHKKQLQIHKEVAKAFLFNPENYKYAIHIGSKYNNHVSNIKWVNKKECQRYNGRSNGRSKAVYKLDAKTLEILEDYDGIREAGRENYLDHKWISIAAKDISKLSGGFKWCLVENYETTIHQSR